MPCPALPALPRPSLPCPALACPAVFNVKLSGLNQIHAGNTPWQVWLACLNPLCSCTNGFLHCMLLCFTSALKHSTGAQKASEWLSGQSPLSSAAVCKTGCQQACVSSNTPVEICCSYSCAMIQHQCTATHLGKKQSPLSSVAVCKTGCQQACVSANTPVEICCSCSCAMTHDKCTATLFLAKSSHHCPVLLYAKQVHSKLSVPAITPVEICSSYSCAMTHHKCTAALLLAKCNPHCSVLFCKTGAQQA